MTILFRATIFHLIFFFFFLQHSCSRCNIIKLHHIHHKITLFHRIRRLQLFCIMQGHHLVMVDHNIRPVIVQRQPISHRLPHISQCTMLALYHRCVSLLGCMTQPTENWSISILAPIFCLHNFCREPFTTKVLGLMEKVLDRCRFHRHRPDMLQLRLRLPQCKDNR